MVINAQSQCLHFVQELVLDGDTSSLYYTARGLMQLQGLYGTIGQVKGKGPHALAVKNLLTLMRKEMGAKAPRTGQSTTIIGVLFLPGNISVQKYTLET